MGQNVSNLLICKGNIGRRCNEAGDEVLGIMLVLVPSEEGICNFVQLTGRTIKAIGRESENNWHFGRALQNNQNLKHIW